MTLTNYISFNVKFLFTGTPSLLLTPITTLGSEEVDLKGYFKITQPDCISESGNYASPDAEWDATALTTKTIQLRLGADQLFQKGTYSITFYADHPDYLPGEFTRTFDFNYKPVTQTISQNFDLFTPDLSYSDDTVYKKSGFATTTETSAWTATSPAGAITPSSVSDFDLVIGGGYYDSIYVIAYTKTALYTNTANTWLTVLQGWDYSATVQSYIPQSMAMLLTYLTSLKDNGKCDYQVLYEKAETLFSHIRARVCNRQTAGLKEYVEEFYRLTHSYQPKVHTNTNTIIPAYDFTTGCTGASVVKQTYSITVAATVDGQTVFAFNLPSGYRIIRVQKGIVKLNGASYSYTSPNLTLIGASASNEEEIEILYEA